MERQDVLIYRCVYNGPRLVVLFVHEVTEVANVGRTKGQPQCIVHHRRTVIRSFGIGVTTKMCGQHRTYKPFKLALNRR